MPSFLCLSLHSLELRFPCRYFIAHIGFEQRLCNLLEQSLGIVFSYQLCQLGRLRSRLLTLLFNMINSLALFETSVAQV